MPNRYNYFVSIGRTKGSPTDFFNFLTDRISALPTAAKEGPIKNELHAGVLFESIKLQSKHHRRLSIVVPEGNRPAVLALHELKHQNPHDIQIGVVLNRISEKDVGTTLPLQCLKDAGAFSINNARLLNFVATGKTFTATFEVTGPVTITEGNFGEEVEDCKDQDFK